MVDPTVRIVRPAAESLFEEELLALHAADVHPRPPNWRLSPRMVKTFILGSRGAQLPPPGDRGGIEISQKFFGDDALVERAIVTLASQRSLMLAGEPGTAKSMLSELLAAAISGTSLFTIQGSAATTEDHIKYSWNYALLLAKGPTPEALVPSPLYASMKAGKLCRFEELTRCPIEVQDSLVGVLSDKVLFIPELAGEASALFAAEGFNLIATANSRDRGVNEMSAALKRRFNFETVRPIGDPETEIALVAREAGKLLARSHIDVGVPRDVIDLLVTTFQELRSGESREGVRLDKPKAPLSTAEAVQVAYAAGLHAYYYGSGRLTPAELVLQLPGTVVKDAADDLPRLMSYFEIVVRERAKQRGGVWGAMLEASALLPKVR